MNGGQLDFAVDLNGSTGSFRERGAGSVSCQTKELGLFSCFLRPRIYSFAEAGTRRISGKESPAVKGRRREPHALPAQ